MITKLPGGEPLDPVQQPDPSGSSCRAGTQLNAVGDGGVPFWDIAVGIGRHLNLPVTAISREEADGHFGFFALPASSDVPDSSALTQHRFGWYPRPP